MLIGGSCGDATERVTSHVSFTGTRASKPDTPSAMLQPHANPCSQGLEDTLSQTYMSTNCFAFIKAKQSRYTPWWRLGGEEV
jgi:hypothetical protein